MLDRAKKVFAIEAESILKLQDRLDENFVKAVNMLLACNGKVIVIGIGKSGIIGRKIASTLACSGTPAFFLHPAEGIHGDIGMMAQDDVVIAISNSGETDEVLKVLPVVKRMGLPLIVLTGNSESVLARNGDIVLDIGVKEEAGALGKKLLLRVEDLMHVKDAVPMVSQDDSMSIALIEMTSKRLGITGVCDRDENFVGVITDGDLRRALEKRSDILSRNAQDVMTLNPKTITKTALAASALRVMERHSITSLFVLSESAPKKVEGLIHLHDILKAGVV
ncbi:MAG: SIS domain-containing protein [Proteobacteria bacterium]|nr:SIS domain-containing protein [Pseudomonadota bacterium]